MPVSGTNPCEIGPQGGSENQIGKHCLSIGFSELVRSVVLGRHFYRLFLDGYNSIVDYSM
jgi:hypothetical protein